MYNIKSESISDNPKKCYLYVETTEDAIRDFKASPALASSNIKITHMFVEGEKVPAFRFEVDESELYHEYKRDEWQQEDQYKQENRCVICGSNGKSRRCPTRIPNPDYTGAPGQTKTLAVNCEQCPYGYNRLFKPVKGKVVFSNLDITDSEDNTDAYDPASPDGYGSSDNYTKLLNGLIDYIKIKYPKYADYTELLSLLGNELDVKEAAEILDKPKSSIYNFLKKAREFYDEYRDTVDFM